MDYDNKTLPLACFSFNAVENPRLMNTHPIWAALIVNRDYVPYLAKRFPTLRQNSLKTDKTGPHDAPPFSLVLIPTKDIPPAALENWEQANRFYTEINWATKNRRPSQPLTSFMEPYFTRLVMMNDPFLKALYWEKRGFFDYLDHHLDQAAQDYEEAIREGVPAAHLYYDAGVCLQLEKKYDEARKYLQEAYQKKSK